MLRYQPQPMPADRQYAIYPVTVQPTQEPVCPTWLADALRLTDSGEAANLVSPARQQVEHDTRRSLLTQTRQMQTDRFPVGEPLRLNYPPVQSVEQVEYYDPQGMLRTLDPADYRVELARWPGYVHLSQGKLWPDTWRESPAVLVTFIAGYPDPDTLDKAEPNAKYAIRDAAAQTLFPQECKWQQSYHRLVHLMQWGDYP